MILAKISEGLIGSEGAIYPCPKGQGVIAKSWVLNDKNLMLSKYPEIEYPQSIQGFFLKLNPFDGSLKTIKKMMEHPRFEVFFATAPSIHNPLSYLEKRLSIEFFFGLKACENLIIISKKNKLDDYNVILIDDNITGNGQDLFYKGQHIHFGSEDFPNWEKIDNYFFIK